MRARTSLWDEMRQMQEQMDALFNTFFSRNPFFSGDLNLLEGPKHDREIITSNYKQPLADIYETEKEVVVDIELPGMKKKDIKVHVTDEGIEVKAEAKNEIKHEDKKKGVYRFERNYSGFCRHISLPSNTDAKKARAEYKDGLLKITVPKTKLEEQKKKLIEVK